MTANPSPRTPARCAFAIVDSHFGFLDPFAACFTDHREAELIEHSLGELLKQRVFGILLGYEDLNDHDRLRFDQLLAIAFGRAEHITGDKANPRFVVTSLLPHAFDAVTLYENDYCARGDMENRIKEQQLELFADRLSCETMRANQSRLSFSTVAYVVMRALREYGLRDTPMAQAQCETIRVKLFKIGARVTVRVRRVVVSMSEAYPFQELFAQVWANLQALRATSPAATPHG